METTTLKQPHICNKPEVGEENVPRGDAPVWVDKQGKEYWCECEITDQHLLNIIKFLNRMRDSLSYPMFHGEVAQECAEREFRIADTGLSESAHFFEEMAEERGIEIK